MDITFNHHGITATIDETVIDWDKMENRWPGDQIGKGLRQPVRLDLFPGETPTYSDATDTTTFTFSGGTITIPNELISHYSLTNDGVQEYMDELSAWLIQECPVG